MFYSTYNDFCIKIKIHWHFIMGSTDCKKKILFQSFWKLDKGSFCLHIEAKPIKYVHLLMLLTIYKIGITGDGKTWKMTSATMEFTIKSRRQRLY